MIPIQAMKCLEICIYIYTYMFNTLGSVFKGKCIGKHIIFIIYGKCIDGNLGGFCRQAARCAISGEFEGGEK